MFLIEFHAKKIQRIAAFSEWATSLGEHNEWRGQRVSPASQPKNPLK
jgi:hypothetical protein